MNAILLAMSLVSYGGQPTMHNGMTYQHGVILPARTLPARVGYEIAPPERHASVTLEGNVVRPGDYRYFPGMTVSDLVGLGGSFVHEADYENIRVIRATERGDRTYILSWLQQWQTQVLLEPGDTLVVPDRSLSTY